MEIKTSANFKKMTVRAILAILLFITVYLSLIFLSFVLTYVCFWLAYKIVFIRIGLFSVLLSIGIVMLAFIIIFFLFKFLFKTKEVSTTNYKEIFQEDEPKLFAMIDEIVEKVNTKKPKKVFLSHDINASVFYNSSFWSMIFPVRKNLVIGVGLISISTEIELKAVLSHEFGHFSQKSMKVGSFVYNTNKVLYNLLFDNESFDETINSLSEKESYIGLFAGLSRMIIVGIQKVLIKIYRIINIQYNGLSREMEFNADEIAAHVTGPQPLIDNLLRFDFGQQALDTVFSFYNSKIEDCVASKNVYKEQLYVMNILGEHQNYPFENNLPKITLKDYNKYNKSRFHFEDQWASHPTLKDRVEALSKVKIESVIQSESARNLFKKIDLYEEEMSTLYFSSVKYQMKPEKINLETFVSEFEKWHQTNDKIYNHYYDQNGPIIDSYERTNLPENTKIEDLFSNEKTELIIRKNCLESDLDLMKRIAKYEFNLEQFDFDGQKYEIDKAYKLVPSIEDELSEINKQITTHNHFIFNYFLQKANDEKAEDLIKAYKEFSLFSSNYLEFEKWVNDWNKSTYFFSINCQIEDILANLKEVKKLEEPLKQELLYIIDSEHFASVLTDEMKTLIEKYLSKDWKYFTIDHYEEDAISILRETVDLYMYVKSSRYLFLKNTILNLQIEIEKSSLNLNS